MKLHFDTYISSFVLGGLATLTAVNAQSESSSESFEWTTLGVTLPKPLSDHTATRSRNNNLMYIAGGCDSPLGNQFAGDYFFCATLSNSLFVFDPSTSTVEQVSQMPQARYRHAAEIIGSELWLIGGRDVEDNLITDIDIYNVESKEWRSLTLPDDFLTSDHASFTGESSSKFIYVAGGYNQTYSALATVFRIDTTTSSDGTASIGVMAPLLEARGDIYAASNGAMAFLGGGFTDANGFCAPLSTVESYNIADNTWTYEPELINERGEITMVELDGKLLAMGGERQIDNICDITGDTDPGELTVGLEVVEVLENGVWTIVDEFPTHRFRFAAVDDEEGGVVYAFGGQIDYDDSCECFQTTNEIQLFVKTTPSSAFSRFNHAAINVAAATTIIGGMLAMLV